MPTPYDAYTDSIDVVASYILSLLKASATTLGVEPARGFYYGEQELIPTTPGICVVPGAEADVYDGVGGRPVMITFLTYVVLYVDVLQDIQLNTHQAAQLSTLVKHVVHADKNLGGNVLDCLCIQVEPGYALKKGSLMAASRLTFRSRAKKILNP